VSGGMADLDGRVHASAAIDGARFALDAPQHVDAILGTGSRVLWATGEPFMIAGGDGVGKTTVGQQLALRLAGIGSGKFLGLPVAALEKKVLYLALDRPQQAARSMRRMVSESDRDRLARKLTVWQGELPFDIIANPAGLLPFAEDHDAQAVIIDSLKDLAGDLSKEETGQAINKAMQICVANGVEILDLHHQRKAQADNKKPKTLSDIYGSRWLTAGCGSVAFLHGDAGDPLVELLHLKQPADEVGPLTLLHDNQTGATTVAGATDVVDVLGAAGEPLTAKDVAARLFKVREPQRKDIVKAKRRLDAAVKEGRAERLGADSGEATTWATPEGVHTGGAQGCTGGVHGEGAHSAPRSEGACTPAHNGSNGGAHTDHTDHIDPNDLAYFEELRAGFEAEQAEASA
jgi:replicative DNA helicase